MASNEDIFKALIDLNTTCGRLEGKTDGMMGHLSALGSKAEGIRKDLAEHKEDNGAHGVRAQRDGGNWLIAKITAIITVLEVITHWKGVFGEK